MLRITDLVSLHYFSLCIILALNINYIFVVSPCRCCQKKQADLFSLAACEPKTQAELVRIWNENKDDLSILLLKYYIINILVIILLDVYGNKTAARTRLSEYGLKDTPPLIMLEDIVEDICMQSPLGL